MPTTLELIFFEKVASLIFIISSFQSLFSAFEAERYEYEKQQNKTSSDSDTQVSETEKAKQEKQQNSDSTNTNASAVSSIKLGLDSTLTGILGFFIFLVVAVIRKEQLEQEVLSGTTKISTLPNILIISGFLISIIGNIIRVPAIQQRLIEAQRPVIL